MRATLEAFELVPSFGERLLRKHGFELDRLDSSGYVLVQKWLDMLKEIQRDVGREVLRGVGSKIVSNAKFPPELDSVPAVLQGLDHAYQLNHRGDVGHYRSDEVDGTIVIRCETPYPRDFERGLVEGICEHPRLTKGVSYLVDYVPAPEPGVLTCTMTVRARSQRG